MRGSNTQLLTNYQPADDYGSMPDYVSAPGDSVDPMENNLSFAITPGSLYTLLLFIILYAVWGAWENKESMKESFSVGDMKVNLGNMVKTTIGVVIGINVINVFLTKLAYMRIPGVSKIAGSFLPLFSL